METINTTKMSSKGQVVIPEDIRNQLDLKSGTQFIVLGDKDTVILKTITPPKMDEFNDLIKQVRKEAKKACLTKADILEAIKKVRK